jgi:pilus assembly protein CpaE
MKIAVVAKNYDSLVAIKDILEKHATEDQFVFLERKEGDLDLNRIDLVSTNVLIIDAAGFSKLDLKAIAACTSEHANPGIIYLMPQPQDSELLELMRAGVMEVISSPMEKVELLEALERLRSKRYIASTYRPRGKVLAFLSAKGGAGATFIACNLGYALANQCNQKVLIIDLHMQFGDAAFYLLESAGPRTLSDIISQTGLDSTVIASATIQISENYFLLQAPDSPDKAVGIKPQHIDNLLTVAIQDYDYVIVDLPREIDAVTMKVMDRAEKLVVVFQPVVSYLRAVAKILPMFGMLGYEQQKIKTVLNRADQSLSIPIEKMEDAIQKKIDWVFPNDFLHASESVNVGVPIQRLSPNIPLSHRFTEMARNIEGSEEATNQGKSWFQKWFS